MPTNFFKEAAFTALLCLIAAISFSIALFEIAASFLIGFTLISLVKKKDWHFFKNVFFFLIAVYFTANLLSLLRSEYLAESLRGLLKVGKGALICFSAFYVVDSEEKFKKVFQCFLFVGIFIGIDALIQGLTGYEVIRMRPMTPYRGEIQRWTGPFRHANDFSGYLSFISVLFVGAVEGMKKFFSLKKYTLFFGGMLLVLLCLVQTYSRGAWVAVGITLFLFVIFRKKPFLAGLLMLAIFWGFFFGPRFIKERAQSLLDTSGGTIVERKELWGESFRMLKESPWVGLGVNTYSKNEPKYKLENSKTDFQYAHNGYLQIAAETGWLGFLSFLGLLFYFIMASFLVFLRAKESFLKAAGFALLFGVISFLIHSATDTNLQSVLLVNTLWLGLGVTWSARNLVSHVKISAAQ